MIKIGNIEIIVEKNEDDYRLVTKRYGVIIGRSKFSFYETPGFLHVNVDGHDRFFAVFSGYMDGIVPVGKILEIKSFLS